MRSIKNFRNPNTKEFWEKKYGKYIEEKYIRSDGKHLLKFKHLFEKARSILDFGSGLGGNVQYLSTRLEETRFTLVDHSETSQKFVLEKLLGRADDHGNSFDYQLNLTSVADNSMDLVMSIEVLEHITAYKDILNQLWRKVKPGGTLFISVPVLGIRDRTRVHVNKFTVKSMFKMLSLFAEIVHISPRTYSKKSGRLSTAYFYIEKPGK